MPCLAYTLNGSRTCSSGVRLPCSCAGSLLGPQVHILIHSAAQLYPCVRVRTQEGLSRVCVICNPSSRCAFVVRIKDGAVEPLSAAYHAATASTGCMDEGRHRCVSTTLLKVTTEFKTTCDAHSSLRDISAISPMLHAFLRFGSS